MFNHWQIGSAAVLVVLAGCHIVTGLGDVDALGAAGMTGTGGDGGMGGDSGMGGAVQTGVSNSSSGQGGVAPCNDQGCPDGTPCMLADICASGFCWDGVCCNEACDGVCESCVAADTDSPDGQCAPVTEGFDPADECAANNVCNDSGVCDSYCNVDPTPIQPSNCPSICTNCNSGICEIQCNTSGDCQGIVTCPAGMDCDLDCNGAFSCQDLILDCPETYHCDVACTGDNACNDSTISGTTGKLDVACAGFDNACLGMAVACGAGSCQLACLDQTANNPPTVQANNTCGLMDGCNN